MNCMMTARDVSFGQTCRLVKAGGAWCPSPRGACVDEDTPARRTIPSATRGTTNNLRNMPTSYSKDGTRGRASQTLLLHILLELLGADFRGKQIALSIGSHPFDAGVVVLLRVGLDERNHRCDFAIFGAPDPNASCEPRILFGVRLGIGHVHVVVPVDVDAARPAELFPLIEEASILIEDLNAAVAAVGHEDSPARIDRDAVRSIEFTGSRSPLTPRFDELAVLRELHDSVDRNVGDMAVGNEDVAVLGDHDIARSAEHVITATGDTRLAERHP